MRRAVPERKPSSTPAEYGFGRHRGVLRLGRSPSRLGVPGAGGHAHRRGPVSSRGAGARPMIRQRPSASTAQTEDSTTPGRGLDCTSGGNHPPVPRNGRGINSLTKSGRRGRSRSTWRCRPSHWRSVRSPVWTLPRAIPGTIISETGPLRWVLRHWDSLTAEQQSAVEAYLPSPDIPTAGLGVPSKLLALGRTRSFYWLLGRCGPRRVSG